MSADGALNVVNYSSGRVRAPAVMLMHFLSWFVSNLFPCDYFEDENTVDRGDYGAHFIVFPLEKNVFRRCYNALQPRL